MTKEDIEQEYDQYEDVPKNADFDDKKQFLSDVKENALEWVGYEQKQLSKCLKTKDPSLCKSHENNVNFYKKEYNRIGKILDPMHGLL